MTQGLLIETRENVPISHFRLQGRRIIRQLYHSRLIGPGPFVVAMVDSERLGVGTRKA
jgi:hypothetical protein